MIPYTNLNICHKDKPDKKRCFVFGYQVTINVADVAPLLLPQLYAKISFNSMNARMLILPGDRVGIRYDKKENIVAKEMVDASGKKYMSYTTVDNGAEEIRMAPKIDDPALPEPFKTRYQKMVDASGRLVDLKTPRLPCNDVMIADSIACENTVLYCTSKTDKVFFSVQGAGEMYRIDKTCEELLKPTGFDWDLENKQLH